jgi:hypothetical protein
MKIEILYVTGCPHHRPAVERIREALAAERWDAEIQEILVRDPAMAEALQFPGSPTIRINGRDVECNKEAEGRPALSCRLYRGGSEGLPSLGAIRSALREAALEKDDL